MTANRPVSRVLHASSVLHRLFWLVGFLLLASIHVKAQTSECVADRYGKTTCPPAKTICLLESVSGVVKCSPTDGGIIADRYSKLQCGTGRCVLDIRGDSFCSKAAGGGAAQGQYGDAVCTGGCVPGQASLCAQLTR